jgi:hypothetical protein
MMFPEDNIKQKQEYMKKIIALLFFAQFAVALTYGQNHTTITKEFFKNPPKDCNPMPLWFINGDMTTEGIVKQMTDAKEKANFSGVTILPLASGKQHSIGTTPKYLTKEYFDRYSDILETAKKLDMNVIMYDDNDFPSGMAGGKTQELFPEHAQKRLNKIEKEVVGPLNISESLPIGQLLSAVAMNFNTLERINLRPFILNENLKWTAPKGNWKIMYFTLTTDKPHEIYKCIDYLDTAAVRQMVNQTYEKYYEKFSSHFGNTIKISFFDDVGFWEHPYMWTGKFNEKFKKLNGFDPEPYYPVLWYNVGPETEAMRFAFFNTRSELLAEGFPKIISDWTKKHKIKDTGHPPGNYDPTPIDMNGDVMKFYRHTAIPLSDVILDYQFGQNGHKLVSSTADYYDRPLVGVEIYGAFAESIFDSLMLYRSMFEMFVRGSNLVIPHAMWYTSGKEHIPPLVSPYSEKIAAALPEYSDFVGRSSYLLRGGRRVSEIGLFYPIESLAGWYRFDDPAFKRQGFFVSPETDYQKISGLLTNEVRKDFTYIHPENFITDKYSIKKGSIKLNNKENFQEYRVMIISGCNIISAKTLSKLKQFYDNGGIVISTTQLPFKSSEIGQDGKVISIIKEIFGVDPKNQGLISNIVENKNNKGGRAIFIKNPDYTSLSNSIEKYYPTSDVQFVSNPSLKTNMGKFSYIHKVKDSKNIFYFANSSNEQINTPILLRGKLIPEIWNPHTAKLIKNTDYKYIEKNGVIYTQLKLELQPVKSVFIISKTN